MKLKLASQLTYSTLTPIAKGAILMLYRRVFSLRTRWFRIGWWTNVGFIVAYSAGSYIPFFLQCRPRPLSTLWHERNSCPLNKVGAMVHGSLNALIDLTILVLAIPMVWALQISRKQKIAVCGIFGLGSMFVHLQARSFTSV